MKRMLFIFKGQVQGVGFRYYIYQLALTYDVYGRVKNLDNGMVEAIFQAPETNINNMLKKIFEKQRYIRIDDYTCKELNIDKNLSDFKIIY